MITYSPTVFPYYPSSSALFSAKGTFVVSRHALSCHVMCVYSSTLFFAKATLTPSRPNYL